MSERTILLVEDNIDEVELIRIGLESSNISVDLVIFQNEIEALDYLFGTGTFTERNFNDMPKLILLDLNLPRVSGVEFLRRVRAERRTQYLPVVIISGSVEPEDIISSYSVGCNSYVRKSVDFRQLQNTLRELALYWLTINEVAREL